MCFKVYCLSGRYYCDLKTENFDIKQFLNFRCGTKEERLAAMAVGAILGAAAFFAFFDYTEKWGNLNIEKKD